MPKTLSQSRKRQFTVPLRLCVRVFCIGLTTLSLARATAAEPITPEQAEFFEKTVRPVLVENCLRCHGPKVKEFGLRLDSRAAMLKGGDGGPVLQPGEPDKSSLIEVVRQTGPVKMPQKGKLKPTEIDALAAWVKMGAPWPTSTAGNDDTAWKKHWAFQPVRNPDPPSLKNSQWPLTPIDRFILAKLEAQGVPPSPAADRRTLIRRVTFDLIGLPPSPEEVAAFEADAAPGAFARVVERLLASPHYGERWGRYWLDVARYADTKGYVFFQDANYPWAYTYRDYVVRSFNDDLPYDQFVVEQLAADRLPLGADRRPLTALGFLTVGGRFMNNPHDILDDRIDVVTRGLLGLTVTCARCHDHKFDPIAAKDYYALYGVFASSSEPEVPPLFADPPKTDVYAAFEKELTTREGKLNEFVQKKQAEVFGTARTRAAEYLLAAHVQHGQPPTEEFMLIADGTDLNPAMLSRWRTYLERTRKRHHPVFAPWHAFAELPEAEFAAKSMELCKRWKTGSDPARALNAIVRDSFAEKPATSLADAAKRYGELLNATEKQWQDALNEAAAAKTPPPTVLPDAAREELRQVFHGPDAPPNVPVGLFNDLALLPDRPSQGELQKLRKAVEDWRANGAGAPPRAMVLQDAVTPLEPHVFLRGNPNNPGEAVPRRFLTVLSNGEPKPFHEGSGRLELAKSIVDRKNPLTARVLVNRIWMHHFGTGLVRTPSDFGLRSSPPSHPDLLDHLATSFMETHWSIKKLHRQILLSAVYQQASLDRTDGRKADPENVLLWRMNRRRLDFEATRDALLAVSGRLDSTVGGPPVRDILAPAATRRTLYGFIDRQTLPTLFRTFDFPSPDATNPQRDNTTIPQQALFLMNNPFVVECTRGLLKRPDLSNEQAIASRVERLYRVLYGRTPKKEELALAQDFLNGQEDKTVAWERYTQALLIANEFSFVD